MEIQEGERSSQTMENETQGASGEARDIASLFREHNHALVRFLTLRLQSENEAKEVAQEAYVRLLQLDRPGVHSFLRAQLFRIAMNIAVDRLRRRNIELRTARAELLDELDDVHEPERNALAAEELELVRRSLDELPETCRRAFLLHRLEGLSVDEIAQRMNVTGRMIRHHLGRALIYCRLRSDGMSSEQAREQMKR